MLIYESNKVKGIIRGRIKLESNSPTSFKDPYKETMSQPSEKKQTENELYGQSLALLTDLYQLTMSYGYWKQKMDRSEAVFHLFFRKRPFGGGFSVAAGLEQAMHYLNRFSFNDSDLQYLATLKNTEGDPLFPDEFLSYLLNLSFSCEVEWHPPM